MDQAWYGWSTDVYSDPEDVFIPSTLYPRIGEYEQEGSLAADGQM